MQRRNPIIAAAIAFAILGTAAFGLRTYLDRPAPPPEGPWNVILLLADTLRADRMSVYGYDRATTPALEARSNGATVFERARSQTACTPTSVASLLTSRYPAELLSWSSKSFAIPESMQTLPEALQAAGLRTIAVSASEIVRKTPSNINRTGGFGRGFDVFDDESCTRQNARCLHQRAMKHLKETTGPFFLYLHYMDVHHPYLPPRHHTRKFTAGDDKGLPVWLRSGDPDPIIRLHRGRPPGQRDVSLDQLPFLSDRYDEEILYLDGEIERLLRSLDGRGLLRKSIVILASDHGEMFLEQDELNHCLGVWDTVTRTPLMVWIPGLTGGRRVDIAVENLDVMPTVLDYAGLPTDALEGESLRPLLEGTSNDPRLAFSSQGVRRSVDDGRFKLIFDLQNGASRLYDLHADPFERSDASSTHPDENRRLQDGLHAWMAGHGETTGDADAIERSRSVEKRLQSLGYLQ
ncbi:MAG: sulfatase [Candidatus Binatia bacterium]|nr:sulfatase [Candidatus Binatia bacterium]